MKELKGKDLLLVGITLFAMFFGAGNLIFPPFLGAQAGTATWIAMAGFAMTAIGFPILGVIAIARAGGMRNLSGRVSPAFSAVFTMLIYLSIGPCLAIPRTASTSFGMAVTPFVGPDANIALFQLLYSIVFFAIALVIALRPEKLTERLGRILCPTLIVLIVVVFVACIVNPVGSYGPVMGNYVTHPAVQGFLDGYLTMDTIAALNFGAVIALNVRARGVTEDKYVVKGIIKAGWIAGAIFLVIYSMLAHIGALSGGAFPGAADGTGSLTNIVSALFGPVGAIILAGIFVIACLNTCIGLISCVSEYFHSILPKISYRAFAVFFAAVSMVVSNAGLAQILKVSVPVLNAIYPPAIVLILLSCFQRWIGDMRFVYPVAIGFTSVASVLYAVVGVIGNEALTKAFNIMPLASLQLGWVIPAAVGVLLGLLLSKCVKPKELTA
ncbi:MAG: branched-chain amino acid transport system II carrier protein [Oscillospiraceae bacterium]